MKESNKLLLIIDDLFGEPTKLIFNNHLDLIDYLTVVLKYDEVIIDLKEMTCYIKSNCWLKDATIEWIKHVN